MVKGSSSPLKRRGFVALLGASSSIAGCLERSSPVETEGASTSTATHTSDPSAEVSTDTPTDTPTDEPTEEPTPTPQSREVDTGVMWDTTVSEFVSEEVLLRAGQKIEVEVGSVDEGEMLFFMVAGNGHWPYRERLREDQTQMYPIKEDGYFNIKLHPKRYEYPMNKEVEIDVIVTLTEPQS